MVLKKCNANLTKISLRITELKWKTLKIKAIEMNRET